MKVGIVAYDGCTASMIVGPMDIFSFASNQYQAGTGKKLFDLAIITETGSAVKGFNNFDIQAQKSIKTKSDFDLIYIPGFVGDLDSMLLKQVKLIAWLKKQYENGVVLAAACNGNFFLAEAGALDNKRATTHWSLINTMEERYRKISVEPEKIVVDNGSVISGAGVTAYFNLALFLVERYGSKDLALTSSKVFLVDAGRKIQTPYQMFQIPKNHGDEEIARLQDWLESNFSKEIALEKMAQMCHISERTLARRFKKATGDSPILYVQKLRLENAKRLLESKLTSFNEITWKVGYQDISTFHKVFKEYTGLTPLEYRSKFSMV